MVPTPAAFAGVPAKVDATAKVLLFSPGATLTSQLMSRPKSTLSSAIWGKHKACYFAHLNMMNCEKMWLLRDCAWKLIAARNLNGENVASSAPLPLIVVITMSEVIGTVPTEPGAEASRLV